VRRARSSRVTNDASDAFTRVIARRSSRDVDDGASTWMARPGHRCIDADGDARRRARCRRRRRVRVVRSMMFDSGKTSATGAVGTRRAEGGTRAMIMIFVGFCWFLLVFDVF